MSNTLSSTLVLTQLSHRTKKSKYCSTIPLDKVALEIHEQLEHCSLPCMICVPILGTLLSSLSYNSIIEQMYQNIIIITAYKTLRHAHRLAHLTPDQTVLVSCTWLYSLATTDIHLSGTVVSPQSHSSGQE